MLTNIPLGFISSAYKRYVTPALGLLMLITITTVGLVKSTSFELARLTLDNQDGSVTNYQESIMAAVKAHDYDTAEVLLSFLQRTYEPDIIEGINQLIYPERHVASLVNRWNSYEETHPTSTPVLMQKMLLLWQLGDLFGVSRLVSEAWKIDPYNQDVSMVMKYMNELH